MPRLFFLKNERALSFYPLIFFAALLFSRLTDPHHVYFDEIHYVPAAKELITFTGDLNWMHPPLGKFIMGLGWLIFTKALHVLEEPTCFRFVSALFGLWTLWSIRAWMLALGFAERSAQAAMWLTGFNFLWFVQSRTAMLDIYFAAFGMWGLLKLYRPRSERGWWTGWILLGLSMACKWSAAPFFVLALFLGTGTFKRKIAGGAVSFLVYLSTFLPLAFLGNGATGPLDLVSYHQTMIDGMNSIAGESHPYISQWWQWPTLLRPMWYLFEGTASAERCIWAGGNPVLFLVALPLIVLVAWFAIPEKKRPADQVARALTLMYWVPLMFWIVAPRKLQIYYYYLVPSLWIGPIVVWAHDRFYTRFRETRGWLMLGFVLLCALTFLYFLPIMDARALAPGLFRKYMWFDRWI